MSLNEPLHDPADLLDELDAVIRAQELLQQRVIALQALYRALESHAESGRFDKLGPDGRIEIFGTVNVGSTVSRLEAVTNPYMDAPLDFLRLAREVAVEVREYPRPEREQVDRTQVEDQGLERTTPTSALADYRAGHALADRGEVDPGRSL
jgi:hypothetical protein